MGLGQGDRGYAMAALLVGLTVAAVLMSAALPVWSHYVQREKEEELIWRGQQYARAIGLFQRKYANVFPPSVDVLVEQKFLRKKYKDPVTGEDFQPIPATGMPGGGIVAMPGMPAAPGGATGSSQPARTPPPPRPAGRMTSVGTTGQGGVGIQGVVSKSDKSSIKIYNGRTKYNEWAFVYMVSAQSIGPGGPQPGLFRGQPGQPGPGQPNQPPNQPGRFGPPGTPNQPGMFGGPGMPNPFGQPAMPSQPGAPGQPPGTTFTPLGGSDRRPPPPRPPGG